MAAQRPSVSRRTNHFSVWSGKLNAIYLHFRFILSALNAPNNNQGKCGKGGYSTATAVRQIEWLNTL